MLTVFNIRSLVILGILAATIFAVASSAFAKPQGDTRPGWGYGDKNHVHTGPPGSVHP